MAFSLRSRRSECKARVSAIREKCEYVGCNLAPLRRRSLIRMGGRRIRLLTGKADGQWAAMYFGNRQPLPLRDDMGHGWIVAVRPPGRIHRRGPSGRLGPVCAYPARLTRPSASARSRSVRGDPESCRSRRSCNRAATASGNRKRARSVGKSTSMVKVIILPLGRGRFSHVFVPRVAPGEQFQGEVFHALGQSGPSPCPALQGGNRRQKIVEGHSSRPQPCKRALSHGQLL
jgi:hypothetical protein